MADGGIFSVSKSGFKYGQTNFATRSNSRASTAQIVHDGDTVSVSTNANLGIRFLGIDTPEISFDFPGRRGFLSLSNPVWREFFTGPELAQKIKKLHPVLLEHLTAVIGDGTDVAENHYRHAANGKENLKKEIEDDMRAGGKTTEDFLFFQAYANEFLDSYGRLLCYLRPHRDNFEGEIPVTSAIDYNIRQLAGGFATPYFIFPNVDPFLRISNPLDKKIIAPDGFWKFMTNASKLTSARAAVKGARNRQAGIYNPTDPLRLLPMELRFIARGSKPNRPVIDLGQPGVNKILDPELYFTIENVEDRFYLPNMFEDYFKLAGWEVVKA
jgi:endonuclease YncB( thermonuclease family)